MTSTGVHGEVQRCETIVTQLDTQPGCSMPRLGDSDSQCSPTAHLLVCSSGVRRCAIVVPLTPRAIQRILAGGPIGRSFGHRGPCESVLELRHIPSLLQLVRGEELEKFLVNLLTLLSVAAELRH